MISKANQNSLRRFKEWASLFSGKLFGQVYCNESDFDQSQTKGTASVPTVYGYIASPDNWKSFCQDWKKVLNDFKVRYFHFSKLNKKARQKDGNEYLRNLGVKSLELAPWFCK
jgi:hypothetical protein